MMFLNEYEVDDLLDRYHNDPILGPAVKTLYSLKEWTNSNSDGWPYWRKPVAAAKSLMELIYGDGTWAGGHNSLDYRKSITPAQVKKATAPIRAFRTRQKAIFAIYEGNEASVSYETEGEN